MSKIKSPRKFAAVSLLGLGLAGVSVASAASLDLNGDDASAVQAGTAAVDGVCQESTIAVSFTLEGNDVGELAEDTSFGYPGTDDAIVLTEIDADCAGKNIKVALGNGTGTSLGEYGPEEAAEGPLALSLASAFDDGPVDAAQVAQVTVTIFD